ncbi:MAG TPA: RNA polymerase sigma factor [Solirubrobacteraceae bacterium]|jgi:RNA polymerase sigma factor (sigma-70 family)|nr:RNA polymerase sigma factor [Solirubrobacteraceae bacterium]
MSPGGFPHLPVVQSDHRLIALARDGDEGAFEAIVRRYRRPLLRYCRRMGLSESRAEDVVQQALLRAWMALGRGGEVRSPKAWLYRTVHNTAVNAMRGAREHGPLDDGAPADFAASAESDFERRVAVRQTLGHVAALPQMQREAILLTAIDGHSHEEIASALGVTHGAVRGLLYRARATLRDAAAAVVPQPALLWTSGLLGRMTPTVGRVAELSAPAGNGDVGAMLGKGAALAATAAVLAVGTGIVPLPRHPAHRSKAAVLALVDVAPDTAQAASRSASAAVSVGDPVGSKGVTPSKAGDLKSSSGELRSGAVRMSASALPPRPLGAAGGEPAGGRASGQGLRESSGVDGSAVLSPEGESLRAAGGSTSTGSRHDGEAGSDASSSDVPSTPGAATVGRDGKGGSESPPPEAQPSSPPAGGADGGASPQLADASPAELPGP